MSDPQTLYTNYQELTQKAADLQYAAAVLGWDQEVYMPSKGYAYRGRQLATLASQAHEIVTNEKYGMLLHDLNNADTLTDVQQTNVRMSLEDYEKNSKLSGEFIEALTIQTSASYNAWIQARNENNYSIYAPHLGKMIVLKREQAKLYGYSAHPYDALLDDYEKGATVTMLDNVFATVREQIPPLLQKIKNAPQVSNDFFHQHYPRQQQWDFSIDVLRKMGFDLDAGRQDISEHPFTTSFAPEDVRITTRVDEENYASLLWSSIHEGGHALYEQGLPSAEYGMPLGAAASLSIHESQSRLWENCVGRSYSFWQYFYPHLQQYFPNQLQNISVKDFYKGINKVQPSLVRTEADELTYHFHVMIRYEIEKALIEGVLDPAEVRDAWNKGYEKYLGMMPPDDKTGVLQDVHWSHGSFGYFPTYSLGSFYAAQFFQQALNDVPELAGDIQQGNYENLLQWLRKHVHQYGRRFRSEELCNKITGKGLDMNIFMRYASSKYTEVYDLK